MLPPDLLLARRRPTWEGPPSIAGEGSFTGTAADGRPEE